MSRGPFLVVPTRKGSVPNLTPSQAREILSPDERFISVSLFDAIDFRVSCQTLQMCFSDFCGVSDFRTILVNRSSFQGLHQSAPTTDSGISGDCEKGRATVTIDKYEELIRVLKPNIAVTLAESVPLSEPLTKCRRIAHARTEAWTEKIETYNGLSCCKFVKPFSVRGAMGGFLDTIPRNENLWEHAFNLIEATKNVEDVSFFYGMSMPSILLALAAGVNWIESPLPWVLADKGVALTLAFTPVEAQVTDPEIDLNDDCYTLDIRPLCKGCTCYTCQRHNRAYLHHLLTVQEMNSTILLAIHNLNCLASVFRCVRELPFNRREPFLKLLVEQY